MIALLASSFLHAALAMPVAPGAGDGCEGDPGLVLTMQPEIAIGATLDVAMSGTPGQPILLLVSLDDTPTPTAYGTLCIGFPTLYDLLMQFDEAGRASLETTIPYEEGLIGTTFYAQFIQCGGPKGHSNSRELTVIPPLAPGDFATFTQKALGGRCEEGGNGGACHLEEWFAQAFPNGLTIGDQDGIDGDGYYSITFTSVQAIIDFLPQSGTNRLLRKDATNPKESAAGAIAGELVAARLNLALDEVGGYDDLKARVALHLGDLVFGAHVNPDILGMSVRDFLDVLDLVISGQLGDESTDYDIDFDGQPDAHLADLANALSSMNKDFSGGVSSGGTLIYR